MAGDATVRLCSRNPLEDWRKHQSQLLLLGATEEAADAADAVAVDVDAVDVNAVDVNAVDVNAVDVNAVDATAAAAAAAAAVVAVIVIVTVVAVAATGVRTDEANERRRRPRKRRTRGGDAPEGGSGRLESARWSTYSLPNRRQTDRQPNGAGVERNLQAAKDVAAGDTVEWRVTPR